ncbi:hypothetical protein DRO97_06140 [Archaeoglobales archaeon]|nr:MAG: hypothetical protein DRO97_06140 [Archaeoglobales archaeon]
MDSLFARKLESVIRRIEENKGLLIDKNEEFYRGLLYGYYWAFIELFFSRTPNEEEIEDIIKFFEEKKDKLKV